MPYEYRWHEESKTKPVVCVRCGYPAPVRQDCNESTWCGICWGLSEAGRHTAPEWACWIANHIIEHLKNGPGDK